MADMPFMSYATPDDCLRNAARMMKEGNAEVVKLEWGALEIDMVYRLTECGVPVCAHLGLTPQAIHKYGGYKVQGQGSRRGNSDEKRCFGARTGRGGHPACSNVFPMTLAQEITAQAKIPVIGIGAGATRGRSNLGAL